MNLAPGKIYRAGIRNAVLALLTLMLQIHTNAQAEAYFQYPALLALASCLAVISLSIQRKPFLVTDTGIPVDAENSSSVISRCLMNWSKDAMRIAGGTSNLDAWPVLNYKTRSKNQPTLRNSTQSLTAQVLFRRKHVVLKQWSLTILRTCLTFGSPYCVLRLIACVESGDLGVAWAWLCGIVSPWAGQGEV
jgi:hypothetical protein